MPQGVWAAAPPQHREQLRQYRDAANRDRRVTTVFTRITVAGIAVLVLAVLCSLLGSFNDSPADATTLSVDAGPSAWTVVARWLYLAGGIVFVVGVGGAIILGVRSRRALPDFTRDYVTLLDGAPGTGVAVELQELRAQLLSAPEGEAEQAADRAIADLIETVGITQQELQRTENMDQSADKMAELDQLIVRMSAARATMTDHASDPGVWAQVVRDCRE